MNDLFKKLNVLVKSSLTDLVGETGQPQRRRLTPDRLGKDVDNEIQALRQRVNAAVDYEGELRQRADALREEVARWDQEADAAVANNRDAAARHAIEQMQRAKQRLVMAENDLREHQLVTQELIQRVNMLEATVADVRRAQDVEARDETPADVKPIEGPMLSDVLRQAREKISSMNDLLRDQDEGGPPAPEQTAADNVQAVDDDLAQRRSRLSR